MGGGLQQFRSEVTADSRREEKRRDVKFDSDDMIL